ncbi:MAG: Na/Pi cotransporter family protein [Clostridiales bacterium]|jgi:phosphate:Na+ symporter|nr:Na/Pi cotransporter family protein [Clostridiales bacterium]
MTFFDVVTLLGGLGLFLYGMYVMGDGLERLAGSRLERILQKLTSNLFKATLLGVVITGIIQSSSATTVIVVGFVNSGIMSFGQALGVVMGANIGTTVTGQIIRLSDISPDAGFFLQLLKPSTLAPIAAIVGASLNMFCKESKKRNLGQILLGFGVLFTGMFMMEGAMEPLHDSRWFRDFIVTLENPVLGVLVGAMFTGIIQSSSASIGILQALTTTGHITWGAAVPIVLGANIGTCVTAILASIGASRAARRVAVSHLYFNVLGSFICIALVYGYVGIFGAPFWGDTVNMGDVAMFHTVFNVGGTLIFLPFYKVLVRLAELTVPEKAGDVHPELLPTALDPRLYANPASAIAQARAAVRKMAALSALIVKDAKSILLTNDQEAARLANQREENLDKLEVSVSNYLVGVTGFDLDERESREATMLLSSVGEFERIGDYAINIVQRAGEVYDKGITFSDTAKRELDVLDNAVAEVLEICAAAFAGSDLALAAKVEPLEETIDEICERLRELHIERLKTGQCKIESGIVFVEVLADYERISDHCSNIAGKLIGGGEKSPDAHALLREMHSGRAAAYNELMAYYHEKYKLSENSQ